MSLYNTLSYIIMIALSMPPALPTAMVVVVSPQPPFYREDVVTLRCDISEDTDWHYYWYRDGNYVNSMTSKNNILTLQNEAGQYSCSGSSTQESSTSAPVDIKLSGESH